MSEILRAIIIHEFLVMSRKNSKNLKNKFLSFFNFKLDFFVLLVYNGRVMNNNHTTTLKYFWNDRMGNEIKRVKSQNLKGAELYSAIKHLVEYAIRYQSRSDITYGMMEYTVDYFRSLLDEFLSGFKFYMKYTGNNKNNWENNPPMCITIECKGLNFKTLEGEDFDVILLKLFVSTFYHCVFSNRKIVLHNEGNGERTAILKLMRNNYEIII